MDYLTQLQIDWYTFTRNTQKLISFLESPSYKVRRLVASKLGQLEDVKAIPFLLKKANDPAIFVAETVLYAIKVIAKANNYRVDLAMHRKKLEERKAEIRPFRFLNDFKFEKKTRIPSIKDLMRKHSVKYG